MRSKLLLMLLPLLALTGCSLAQPEAQDVNTDKFIGFHVVRENWDMDSAVPDENGMVETPSADRSHWIEYGSNDMNLDGIGNVSFPNMVLFADYDEDSNEYIFEGMPGINAFATTRMDENFGSTFSGYNGLSNTKITATNDTMTSLEGTIYIEADSNDNYDDNFVCLYQVFETTDGRVYLDGTGNSYGGAGGMGMSQKTEYTTRIGDEEVVESFEITVNIEAISPVASLEVIQFDENNLVISSETITEFGEDMVITFLPDATFIIAVETDKAGERRRSTIDRHSDPDLQEDYVIRYLSDDGGILSTTVEITE